MVEETSTATSQATPGSHLSIGEVLALLLEDFPDVTISKIRFLESQGLIEPERTASGYRKFYDDDVELLRCVLREQKDNFLPLKVIKDRLDTGEIDPTSELQRPRGIKNLPDDTDDIPVDGSLGVSRHPASSGSGARTATRADPPRPTPAAVPALDDTGSIALTPGVVLDAAEVCSMSGLTPEQLAQVESYGVLVPAANGSYDEDGLEIARIAKRFLDLGVDARHLRGWRVAADREAGLFEQVIQPLIRQRNPQSSDHAVAQLNELAMFGGQLRAALMRTLLRALISIADLLLAAAATITNVIPVELVGVRVEVPANTPMVLLREQEGRHRLLPIYIGSPEASAIHYALEGIEPPRPFTHDLFLSTIDQLGASIEKIVVTEMRDRTFYAELHLAGSGEGKIISCRPSDAIALAVRCGASLFAGDELLDEHGQEPPEEPEEDAAEIIDEFKDFLAEVNPEDFG